MQFRCTHDAARLEAHPKSRSRVAARIAALSGKVRIVEPVPEPEPERCHRVAGRTKPVWRRKSQSPAARARLRRSCCERRTVRTPLPRTCIVAQAPGNRSGKINHRRALCSACALPGFKLGVDWTIRTAADVAQAADPNGMVFVAHRRPQHALGQLSQHLLFILC